MSLPSQSVSPAGEPDPASGPGVPVTPAETSPDTAAASTGVPVPADELPDWEPLTPELVEEEAIRGDIVLRGAVVLLALLFGWTKISDSSVLVQVKAGEHMAANGFLPPRTDVFSSSATDHAWVNLSWLGDLWLSALFSIGRERMFTIWGALLSALAFWMLGRTSRAGSPTWWNSIMAGIAVVAAFPWLMAGPTLITVVGTAFLLWRLELHRQAPAAKLWLWLAPAFLLWSNMDSRAWYGLALLWLFALGTLIRRDPTRPDDSAATDRKSLLTAACVSTLAALVHPFHWHVLEAPYVQFAIEYPEIRNYGGLGPFFQWMWLPLTSPSAWQMLDPYLFAGTLLAVLSLLALLLNLRQLNVGHLLMWLAGNGAALASGHLLPLAAIVNAALAGVNAQAWYLRTFRQEYSVAWTELLYSRGGRALTVFSLFGLAYLIINGALTGPAGRRVGMGFDWRILTAISSYHDLTRDSFDDRPFNGRVEHGDYLIWVGQKPFVDSRLAMYARGTSNILDTHRATFFAMLPQQAEDQRTGRPDIWKQTFDKYEITHSYTRLTGDEPRKYNLLMRMFLNPEMRLGKLGAAAAQFYRYDSAVPAGLKAFVDNLEGTNFVERAFRGEDSPPLPGMPVWPRELTTYDRWLIQPELEMPESAQLAEHCEFLANELPLRMQASPGALDVGFALRTLAVRHAHHALRLDADCARAYRLLGRCYRQLHAQEQAIMAQAGMNYVNDLRVSQMLAGSYGGLMTSPYKPVDHEELARVLLTVNYRDAALKQLREVFRLTKQWTTRPPSDPDFAVIRDENRDAFKQLNDYVTQVKEQATAELEKGADFLAIARSAMSAGLPEYALELLTDNETDLVQNPVASLMQAQLMMAVGRIEEGWERLESLETTLPRDSEVASAWRTAAAYANISYGDYDRADELWTQDLEMLSGSRTRVLLEGLPLQASISLKHDLYPASRALAVADYLFSFPDRFSTIVFNRALADMERGRFSEARAGLRLILEHTPDCSLRPLVVYYNFLLTGEMLSVEGPESKIPVWPGMFAEDSVGSGSPSEAPSAEPASEPQSETPDQPKASEEPQAPPSTPSPGGAAEAAEQTGT